MTTSPRATSDAAGRTLRIGDYVGAIPVSSFHPVFGPVTALDEGVVTLQAAEPWTVPAPRAFLIGRPLVGALGEHLGLQLADTGPALFYITPEESEARSLTRVDYIAPPEARERDVCHALILHALNLVTGNVRPFPGVDDGPALVYAASDRMTLTRVDTDTVQDERERAVCRGLLKYALSLAEEPVRPAPVRVDEHGQIQP